MRMYCNMPLDQQTIMKLPTVQLYIEFNTNVTLELLTNYMDPVAYPGILFGGGVSTNSVEDRENGDLGAATP
jgi:hypothetical protein